MACGSQAADASGLASLIGVEDGQGHRASSPRLPNDSGGVEPAPSGIVWGQGHMADLLSATLIPRSSHWQLSEIPSERFLQPGGGVLPAPSGLISHEQVGTRVESV